MRRKGERQIIKKLDRWDPDGHIAQSIATGTHWLDAWLMQNGTPYVRTLRAYWDTNAALPCYYTGRCGFSC